MNPVSPPRADGADGRRLAGLVRDRLRALTNQLSVLNQTVSGKVELRAVDLDCLDLVDRHGPLGPSALARLAGLHPATRTGVLDRPQRTGRGVRWRGDAGAVRRP